MAGNKNSGRGSRAEELKTTELARESITEYYGSLKESFIQALKGKDFALKKFVFEHAFGKPRERVDMDFLGDLQTIQIIQIPDNGRDNPIIEQEPKQLPGTEIQPEIA